MKYLLLFLILLNSFTLLAADYAEIKNLDDSDILYKQLTTEIIENNRLLANNKPTLPLMFYRYTTKETDTMFTLSARLNLSYDTIASLNNLSSPLMFLENTSILLPNINGISVYTDESDTFFKIVNLRLANVMGKTIYVLNSKNERTSLKFVSNERFNSDERMEFLQGFFRSPLDGNFLISSGYGRRKDPFGKQGGHHHNGYDYAVKIGTPVFATREGIIVKTGYTKIYGNHVIIKHANGYESLYGHLSTILLEKGNKVRRDSKIALSGNSGASTGPHLHFEVRQFGKAINPATLLKKLGG